MKSKDRQKDNETEIRTDGLAIRETTSKADMQSDRQTNKQAGRQTDRQRETDGSWQVRQPLPAHHITLPDDHQAAHTVDFMKPHMNNTDTTQRTTRT